MGHYVVICTSHVSCHQIGAGSCAVPTIDAVATGEVNSNDPWLVKMVPAS